MAFDLACQGLRTGDTQMVFYFPACAQSLTDAILGLGCRFQFDFLTRLVSYALINAAFFQR